MLPFTSPTDGRNLYTSDLTAWRALGLDADGAEADHRVPSGFVPEPWRSAREIGDLRRALDDARAEAARHAAEAEDARSTLEALRAALRQILD